MRRPQSGRAGKPDRTWSGRPASPRSNCIRFFIAFRISVGPRIWSSIGEGAGLAECVEVVCLLRKVLTKLQLKSPSAQSHVSPKTCRESSSLRFPAGDAILVGYYETKKLIFAGKVQQGFNPIVRARLLKEMRPLLTRQIVRER